MIYGEESKLDESIDDQQEQDGLGLEALGRYLESVKQEELFQHAERLCRWTRNLEEMEEGLEREINRLRSRKEWAKAKKARIRQSLKEILLTGGLEKIKTATFSIFLRRPVLSLEVDESCVSSWPEAAREKFTKTVISVKKDLLKKDENAENLPGVRYVSGEWGLVIR